MMRKELSIKSVLQPTKTGFLILIALAAVSTFYFQTGSALEASAESEDPRLVLSEALARGDTAVAARVFEAGTDPSWAIVDAARRGDESGLRWLFERGAVATGRPGTRALLWALKSENAELAPLIRAHGGDLDAGDPSGVTLLMSTAAATTKEKRANHVVSALLEAGADVDARSLSGRTALFFAVKADRLKAVRHLLEAGAEVESRDRDGWTPLMLASRDGRQKIVSRLLAAGADPNAQSDAGWTALMWAAWHGHVAVAEELLAAGADPNRQSYAGGTALVRAVQAGRRQVASALLAAGALDSGQLAGIDATEWARSSGRGYIVRLLEREAGR